MTASNSVSINLPIADITHIEQDSDDIFGTPRNDIAVPRPLPNTVDTGRISFGAGYRLPVSK